MVTQIRETGTGLRHQIRLRSGEVRTENLYSVFKEQDAARIGLRGTNILGDLRVFSVAAGFKKSGEEGA